MATRQEVEQIEEQRRKEITEKLGQLAFQKIENLTDNSYYLIRPVTKNNGQKLTSFSIQSPTEQISPVVYIDNLIQDIQDYKLDPEAASDILAEQYSDALENSTALSLDAVKLLNPDNFFLEVINSDQNTDLLSRIPHESLEDLSFIARCRVGDNGTFIVDNHMLGILGMESEEVLEIAKRNTLPENYSIQTLFQVMTGLTGDDLSEELQQELQLSELVSPTIYVVTNESKLFGAAGIYAFSELRQEVMEKVGGEYYILPSSIHETLIIPASNDMDIEDLENMVREVNQTSVSTEDFLSDNIYHVDNDLKIKLVQHANQQQQNNNLNLAHKHTIHM